MTPKSSGLPRSLGRLLCEVTPASGHEHFVWSPLDRRSTRNSYPGPWLEMPAAKLFSQPWQCQVHQGKRLIGAAMYVPESSPGLRPPNAKPPTPKQFSHLRLPFRPHPSHLPTCRALFIVLGILSQSPFRPDPI